MDYNFESLKLSMLAKKFESRNIFEHFKFRISWGSKTVENNRSPNIPKNFL